MIDAGCESGVGLAGQLAHLAAIDPAEAFAASTRRAMRSDLAGFAAFCRAHGLCDRPAATVTVLRFVDDCAGRGHKPATLRRRVASIARWHRLLGYPDPSRGQAVRLALQAHARQVGERQRQAEPLTALRVAAILATTPANSTLNLRNRALLLLARDLLARRSEVVALDVADIERSADGSGTALIRRSKTDQAGRGHVAWLSAATMEALDAFWTRCEIGDGPALRALTRSGRARGRLGSGDVARILKQLADRAGLAADGISGHSCRVGMAHDLAAAGFGLPEIMQAGRWRSATMVARYTERTAASAGAVAKWHQRAAPWE